MTRAELEAITEPYDPRNPPPGKFWEAAASVPAILAAAILTFLVLKPFFIVLRLLLGM